MAEEVKTIQIDLGLAMDIIEALDNSLTFNNTYQTGDDSQAEEIINKLQEKIKETGEQ